MTQTQTALETFYEGWEIYQGYLVKALAPLSPEQLALRAAPNLRSVGELATHIVRTRASWFHNAIGEGSDETAPYATWEGPDMPPRSANELVTGLEATWRLVRDALARWTPEVLAQPFPREWRGETYTLTRQWIIWHLIEHDLHHGGELFFSLGMHGLEAVNI